MCRQEKGDGGGGGGGGVARFARRGQRADGCAGACLIQIAGALKL